MMKRFLIITLMCAYQTYMHGAAGSSTSRTSGLSLMRLQPEFRTITTGSYDESNILSKTILVEEAQRIEGFHEIGQYERTVLKRSFCHLFIRGSEQEYREATVAELAPFETNFDLRASELNCYDRESRLKQAKVDAKEFPDFFHKPQIFSALGDEIITTEGRYPTLSAQFIRSLADDDLQEPHFSELARIAIAVICVHPTDTKINKVSWEISDEKDPLTKTDFAGEFRSPSSAVHFVMCTNEGRDFAKKFLARVNIKEMQRRKNLAENIYLEFKREAEKKELNLYGVAVMPHKSTEN